MRDEFPEHVSIHSVEMGNWYGGGIMHQKIWIFDSRHLYLGSANMDWKSISQVKEMGVAVEDCPGLAADAIKYFESWWEFSALTPASVKYSIPLLASTGGCRHGRVWRRRKRSQSPLAGEQYATALTARPRCGSN